MPGISRSTRRFTTRCRSSRSRIRRRTTSSSISSSPAIASAIGCCVREGRRRPPGAPLSLTRQNAAGGSLRQRVLRGDDRVVALEPIRDGLRDVEVDFPPRPRLRRKTLTAMSAQRLCATRTSSRSSPRTAATAGATAAVVAEPALPAAGLSSACFPEHAPSTSTPIIPHRFRMGHSTRTPGRSPPRDSHISSFALRSTSGIAW